MQNTIAQYLTKIGANNDREVMSALFQAIAQEHNTQALTSAGLVIKGAGNTVVKTGSSAWYGIQFGRLITIAGSTDMPALTGLTVTNATFNVAVFMVNTAGTTVVRFGTAGASLGRVVFPDLPLGFVLIGFVILNPTGTGNFVGGTTPLDDATVVPNAVYISPVGACDPTLIYS